MAITRAPHGRTRRRVTASVFVALTAMSLAACSSSSSSASQTQVCNELDGLVSSMQNLSHTTISENGVAALKDSAQQVMTQLDQLESAVSAQAKPQVATVKAQVQQLQQAAQAVRTAPTAENLATVRTALQTVQSTVTALPSTVQAKC